MACPPLKVPYPNIRHLLRRKDPDFAKVGEQIDRNFAELREPNCDGGGCVEGFRFGFDESRASGANSVDFYTFSGAWSTSGVAITYSPITLSNSFIEIPAGIWTIGANYRYAPSAAPTTGKAELIIRTNGTPGGYVNCRAEESLSDLKDNAAVTGAQGYDTMSTVNYIGASDYIYLTFSHSTDVTLAVYGEIWGVQHAGCDVTLVDDSD